MSQVWNEVFNNWGFASNLMAELIGAAVTLAGVAIIARIWTQHQRWLPTALAFQRLRSYGLHILNLSTGHLGHGFAAEVPNWTPSGALEVLEQYVGDGKEAGEQRATISADAWKDLGAAVVTEFDRLEKLLGNYPFIFADNPTLFRRYALLDSVTDTLRACLEVIVGEDEKQAPGLLEALQGQLPNHVIGCVVASAYLLQEVDKTHRPAAAGDAFAIRQVSAYSRYMEPRYRAYEMGTTND